MLTPHQQLMVQAGIAQSDWQYADQIITIESHWDDMQVNTETGACGLIQVNPCTKSKCNSADDICELRWADSYVKSRYGSWYNALQFHLKEGYY